MSLVTSSPVAPRATTDSPAPYSPVRPRTISARTATVATPVGSFTVIATDDEQPVVLASGWTATVDALLPLIHRSLRPHQVRSTDAIAGVTEPITAYHDGELRAIDDVPVLQRSGPFIEQTWQVLRAVPAGKAVSYTELARRAGRPTAIRAAGSACSRNAAALFVPCHRVTRFDGNVGFFRWGPPIKQWLLQHEDTA